MLVLFLLLVVMLLLLLLMLLLMVVLRRQLARGIHSRRKLPGGIAHGVLLRWNSLMLLLHVIRAVVHERGRETHRLLLISDMLGCRRRMWRRRIPAVRESLV